VPSESAVAAGALPAQSKTANGFMDYFPQIECPLMSPLLKQILHEGNQSGEFVSRVNVFFDDVKREVIKPAETPDGQREQEGGFPGGVVEEKQHGGDNSDEQEQ
jgi:hypothetical protein